MKKTKDIKKRVGVFVLAMLLAVIAPNVPLEKIELLVNEANSYIDTEEKESNSYIDTEVNLDEDKSKVEVHYIDVGQADCILIKSSGENMLIDAGNNNDYKIIDEYLKKENVESLKYVVITHAHEDHIGSMDYVINNYDVEKVYMAKHSSTTQTFKDFVTAVSNKKLKITVPKESETFSLGDLDFKVLTKGNVKYDSTNNYSTVLKATYGDIDYLFTGDAESKVENEMLESHKADLENIEVLKVSHHGGNTSSTPSFVKTVNPVHSIIQVGKDNDYGHPKKQVLDRLESVGSKVYRTDINGTIIVKTDGKNIEVEKEK